MSIARYLPKDRNGRLFKLIEEMGELNAALGKAGRWGMTSVNPELPSDQQETNAAWILREMDDVEAALKECRADVEAEMKPDENGMTPDERRRDDAIVARISDPNGPPIVGEPYKAP